MKESCGDLVEPERGRSDGEREGAVREGTYAQTLETGFDMYY